VINIRKVWQIKVEHNCWWACMGKEAGKILLTLLCIFSFINLMVCGRFNRDPLASVHQGCVWFDHMVAISIEIFIIWNHKNMVKIVMQVHTVDKTTAHAPCFLFGIDLFWVPTSEAQRHKLYGCRPLWLWNKMAKMPWQMIGPEVFFLFMGYWKYFVCMLFSCDPWQQQQQDLLSTMLLV